MGGSVGVTRIERRLWLEVDGSDCLSPFEKSQILPVRNVAACRPDLTLCLLPGQLSGSVEAPAFPSRPDNSRAAARSAGEGRSGAARSHAQRPLRREHGEDGEHRTFPAASTVVRRPSGRTKRRRGWSVRLQQPQRRVLAPPRPRSGVMAAPLSAGPALPGCSVAAAVPGDSDAGAARKCPGAA